jgi:hypothetical protein
MTALESITIAPDSVPERVVDLLTAHGIAVLPGFLSAADLERVRKEADYLLNDEEVGVIERDYACGKSIAVYRDRWRAERYPAVAGLLESPLMRQVATHSLGARCSYNHEFFVTRETAANVPITDLHYDRLPTLKFFIYLLDTDKSNGAFECVPGSHRMVQEIRDYHVRRGVRIFDLPNFSPPTWLDKPVPMEGLAGTMLVFTTDLFHQGGVVSPGRERWILRAHTRPNPLPVYEPKPLVTRQWWRESPFNPMRYFYRAADAVLGRNPPYSDAG